MLANQKHRKETSLREEVYYGREKFEDVGLTDESTIHITSHKKISI